MIELRTLFSCAVALALAGTATAQTVGNLEMDADEVFLRKDCTGYANCVEDDLNGLDTWIWNTRQPSASAPLIVTIGPGDFSGSINCPQGGPSSSGHTTFRGAGRDHTRIVADFQNRGIFPPRIAVFSVTCSDLGFRDLALSATSGGIGAYFVAGGTSSWTNVDIEADQTAWYDLCLTGAPPDDPPLGEHYFFGSRLVANGYGYLGTCDDSWLYGTDVVVELTDGGLGQAGRGIVVGARGVVRIFGSTVRVRRQTATSAPGGKLVGVLAYGYGEFHMHGGIINVDASGLPGADAVSLEASASEARTHVVDTAFVLTAGDGGQATRATGPGQIESPFLWPSGDVPPGGTSNLGSLTGKDLFVETDCAAGGCNGAGSDPHLMIYKEDCPNSPWFDVVRGQCRD